MFAGSAVAGQTVAAPPAGTVTRLAAFDELPLPLHARADGRAFARVPANGSSDRADRGTPARAAECAPLLRGRRRGRRHLLDRINPRLLLRPLMAGALILLLLLSTLPLLRKHERLRLSG